MTGKELKAIRERMGLTQREFAGLVGVHKNSIARQERDEIGIKESLARLIRLLDHQHSSKSKSSKSK